MTRPADHQGRGDDARKLDREVTSRGFSPAIAVRQMSPSDVDLAARLHAAYFPEGFFARLGLRFLRMYYRSVMNAEAARAYVADVDGAGVGYLVGTVDPSRLRREMVRGHGGRLVIGASLALAGRPRLLSLFLRTRLRRYAHGVVAATSGRDHDAQAPPDAVLLYVAVAPALRGGGVGTELVESFLADARRSGCQRVFLVTADGAHGASAYYAARGWVMGELRRARDGRMLRTMTLSLKDMPYQR